VTLDFNATYYWRVDEVNDACEASPWQGRTWSFTTETGKARDPSPPVGLGSISTSGTTLFWTPSCLATQHDIYFSTSFKDVNDANSSAFLGTTYGSDANIATGTLVENKRYYWKVKETGSVTLPEADVWYFQTYGYPLMFFKFDGVKDTNIPDKLTDSTGNVTFEQWLGLNGELIYGQGNHVYNSGGTSAQFIPVPGEDPGEYGHCKMLYRSCFGTDILDLDDAGYTIEAWVRQDGSAGNVEDDDMAGTIIRKCESTYGLAIDDDGAVRFMHDGNSIESESGRIKQGQWHHIAAVYDSSDPCRTEKLYVDGFVVADNNDVAPNPPDDGSGDHVGIGAYLLQTTTAMHIHNHFNGAIDELRVVDVALAPEDFLLRGDPNLAWLPQPWSYETEVPPDSNLIWRPGDLASSHDVYFGTDWDDVNDANTTSSLYKDNWGPNTFDPGLLGFDTTYYWRVDEVNDTTSQIWKGLVWQFTTANYLTIEGFESYGATSNYITDTWIDGGSGFSGNYTGCLLNIGLKAWNNPIFNGEKSMNYGYNCDIFDWGHFKQVYYSEAELPFDSPQNWTKGGTKILTLFFYGKSDNDVNDAVSSRRRHTR